MIFFDFLRNTLRLKETSCLSLFVSLGFSPSPVANHRTNRVCFFHSRRLRWLRWPAMQALWRHGHEICGWEKNTCLYLYLSGCGVPRRRTNPREVKRLIDIYSLPFGDLLGAFWLKLGDLVVLSSLAPQVMRETAQKNLCQVHVATQKQGQK